MHAVPDILPELHPSIDLHVTATALPQEIRLRSKSDKEVEPGVFLLPQQVSFDVSPLGIQFILGRL